MRIGLVMAVLAAGCTVADPSYTGAGIAPSDTEAMDDDSGGGGSASGDGGADGGSSGDGGVGQGEQSSSTGAGDDTTGVVPGCGNGMVGPGEFCFVPGATIAFDGVHDLGVARLDGDDAIDVIAAGKGSVRLVFGAGDGSFPETSTLARGEAVYLAVAATDLDGDAADDIVVARADEDGEIAIVRSYINDGNGTFGTTSTASVSVLPRALVVADLGGDGRTDVAAVPGLGSTTFSYFESLGDGTLATGVPWPAGDQPLAVAAAPLNAGPTVDLAFALRSTEAISVVLNQGAESFAVPVQYALEDPPVAIVAADFDQQDGIDLAVATGEDGDAIVALFNDGSGGFGGQRLTIGVGDNPTDLVAADMDADGDLDLVVVTAADDGLWFVEAVGSGSFAPAVPITVAPELEAPQSIVTADFNDDTVPDLAIGGGHGIAFVLSDP